MITIVASGYFNPLHIGHIRYLMAAKELGNRLVVIVNNDEQVKLKRGIPFMREEERMELVASLKPVDEVFLSIDKDETVTETLALIQPDIFVKGGDKTIFNIPAKERDVCAEFDIEMVFNVGGNKIQASSELIKKLCQSYLLLLPRFDGKE